MTQSMIGVVPEAKMTSTTGIAEQQQYIEKVQQLEQYQQSKMTSSRMESVVEVNQPPQFNSPIQDQVNVREGGFAHFEARLEPMGDHSMVVEWFKDGRPVDASSRITSFFNFGYVALTIKQVLKSLKVNKSH
jgi:titin